jgi:hypothetical protein
MSLLAVQGGVTGTGTVTLLAPVTNTDRTLTLPDVTGTVAVQGGAGVGKVLQVVQGTYSSATSSASGTFVDTGLTATITPSSASNKILVIVQQAGCGKDTNNITLQLQLVRDSTALFEFESSGGYTGSSATNFFGTCGCSYLDSPVTASPVTYKTQMSAFSGSATVFTQYNIGSGSPTSTITLLEIAA